MINLTNTAIVDLLDDIRNENLYLHDAILENVAFKSDELKNRNVYLVETLSVINILVHKGTMLLYGGHGGGKTTLLKYLGRIFMNKSISDIEDGILRCHSELTEEKIIGSLDIKQILDASSLKDGANIKINWSSFVQTNWKIIDEINRLSPYAQNILLSLLAEGVVKYYYDSKSVGSDYTVFATMNPTDKANYDLSKPFLDRFALALPISMPDFINLKSIGKRGKNDENINFISRLNENDLIELRDNINQIPYDIESEEFINNIFLEYNLCERGKNASSKFSIERGLCTLESECHYFVGNSVCKSINESLSIRVKEDLFRYGKALAWFLGSDKVEIEHIKAIAPYAIWHRSELTNQHIDKELRKNIKENKFTFEIRLAATKQIINNIFDRFKYRYKNYLIDFNKAFDGKLKIEEIDNLINRVNEGSKNDLLLKKDISEALAKLKNQFDIFQEYSSNIDRANSIILLNDLFKRLKREYTLQNRSFLIDKLLTKKSTLKIEKYDPLKFVYKFNSDLKEHKLLQEILVDHFDSTFPQKLLNTKTTLSTNKDDFSLEVKGIDNKSMFTLEFIYRGATETKMHSYLSQLNDK